MRAFTVLLFCLAIACQSVVAARAVDKHCTMAMAQDGHGGMHAEMMASVDSDHGDCCNDAETAAKTGKMCKSAQSCNLSQMFTLASFHALIEVPFSLLPATMTKAFVPPSSPGEIWRPPSRS